MSVGSAKAVAAIGPLSVEGGYGVAEKGQTGDLPEEPPRDATDAGGRNRGG